MYMNIRVVKYNNVFVKFYYFLDFSMRSLVSKGVDSFIKYFVVFMTNIYYGKETNCVVFFYTLKKFAYTHKFC